MVSLSHYEVFPVWLFSQLTCYHLLSDITPLITSQDIQDIIITHKDSFLPSCLLFDFEELYPLLPYLTEYCNGSKGEMEKASDWFLSSSSSNIYIFYRYLWLHICREGVECNQLKSIPILSINWVDELQHLLQGHHHDVCDMCCCTRDNVERVMTPWHNGDNVMMLTPEPIHP